MSNEIKNYNMLARLIHWVSAVVIIGMFAVGLWMVDLNYYSQWYKAAPHWHKSVGLLLAAITLLRIIWKQVTRAPSIEGKRFEVVLAKLAHIAIYLLLIVIFTSGYLISTEDGRAIDVFNWFSVPGAGKLFEGQADSAGVIHYYAACSLILLATLHIIAALKHHFINKDNTLRKMLGVSK